jgi:TRAP-type uncharacterized transport system substrate-binding protein
MTRSIRRLFIFLSTRARYVFPVLILALAIGGLSIMVFKGGHVRLPLKVATGPALEGVGKFLATITQILAEERPLVQLERIKTESMAASARALEDGKSDLAVVRSDIAMPKNGSTIAIFRRDNLVLIVPAKSGIENFQGLAGKKVALFKEASAEQDESLEHLLDAVLGFHGLSPQQVRRQFLSLDEIGLAVARKQVAGVLVLGPPGPGPIAKVIAAISHATRRMPELIGAKNAEALAKTIPGTEPDEIEAGAFGGVSPQPDETLGTLAVTYRLVGRYSLPDLAAGEIARMLSLAKARLLSTSRLAMQIEAPDSDDGSGLPIHPGAAAFFEGEQTSLVDSATGIFYMASIILGIAGSGFVWLLGVWRRRAVDDWRKDIDRLVTLMREGKNADSETLSRFESEIDEMVVRSLGKARASDADQLNILFIVISQARLGLEKRLRAIQVDKA